MELAVTAFLVGLFSGVHCVAMCGGIVGALSMPRASALQMQPGGAAALRGGVLAVAAGLPIQLAYSVGRISSYAVAGTIAGGIGGIALLTGTALPVQTVLAVLANVLLLLLAAHLAGVGRWVARLEALGGPVWRRLAPYGRRFVPADTPGRAFAVGAVWGWLPCGLVYSTLAMALMSGEAARGALVMLAFGLGTLPNLVAAGLAVQRLRPLLGRRTVRLGAAALVAGLAIAGLARVPAVNELIRAGLLCLS